MTVLGSGVYRTTRCVVRVPQRPPLLISYHNGVSYSSVRVK